MSEVLLLRVVPALGAVLSLVMYATPIKAVTRAAASNSLGDTNPIPFALTVANTIAWATYGMLKKDPFVTLPNALGVALAIYCVITAYGIADTKVKKLLRDILCFIALLFPALGMASTFFCSDLQEKLKIWGIAGNTINLLYYGAPLSTMGAVIKTRNSASILLPLTLANMANAVLWSMYGLAVLDAYIFIPSTAGTLLSAVQLVLIAVYPARHTSISSISPPTKGSVYDEEDSHIA